MPTSNSWYLLASHLESTQRPQGRAYTRNVGGGVSDVPIAVLNLAGLAPRRNTRSGGRFDTVVKSMKQKMGNARYSTASLKTKIEAGDAGVKTPLFVRTTIQYSLLHVTYLSVEKGIEPKLIRRTEALHASSFVLVPFMRLNMSCLGY